MKALVIGATGFIGRHVVPRLVQQGIEVAGIHRGGTVADLPAGVRRIHCNRNRLEDFPNISRYLRSLYLVPGIAATVNIDHIKRHYYMSHAHINPTRIVPVGPRLTFCAPAE